LSNLLIKLYHKSLLASACISQIGRRSKQRSQGGEGVRQGCTTSPLLFKPHSEFMIREAMEGMKGAKTGGKNITDLRYADDAVLVADRIGRMQRMMNSLKESMQCIWNGDQCQEDQSNDSG
jgi:hypothetical protein